MFTKILGMIYDLRFKGRRNYDSIGFSVVVAITQRDSVSVDVGFAIPYQ